MTTTGCGTNSNRSALSTPRRWRAVSSRSKTAAPMDWFWSGRTRRPSFACLAMFFAPLYSLCYFDASPTLISDPLLPSDSRQVAGGHCLRFTQRLVAVLHQQSAVPEVDPPDIAGAQLLQCREKSGFISACWRGDQQRRVASEEYALCLVVKADRVATVTGRVDHVEVRVTHFDCVPIAQQAIDAIEMGDAYFDVI